MHSATLQYVLSHLRRQDWKRVPRREDVLRKWRCSSTHS